MLDNDKNYCKMEIELKAQMIVRIEIMEMWSTSDAQLKDHVNNANKLQVYIQTFIYALGLQSLSWSIPIVWKKMILFFSIFTRKNYIVLDI